MKYRVKFKCYWYNTGAADNHYYIRHEDFDTFEQAQAYRDRVNEQVEMLSKVVVYPWQKYVPSDYEIKYNKVITIEEKEKWEKTFEMIEVENGFIEGEAEIFEYYPAVEKKIT